MPGQFSLGFAEDAFAVGNRGAEGVPSEVSRGFMLTGYCYFWLLDESDGSVDFRNAARRSLLVGEEGLVGLDLL